MLLRWYRDRCRRAFLREPFPLPWLPYLERNVAPYRTLGPQERERLRNDLRIFIREKDWEGCGGLEITDEMKVTIAAHACVLLLGLDHDYYENVQTIIVYPAGFLVPRTKVRDQIIITELQEPVQGEAHLRGPVILAWEQVLENGRDPSNGENLVYHEFAHQLDFQDGVIDGTPPLETDEQYRRWRKVMTKEFRRLGHDRRRGRDSPLDPYGARSPAEFFAVATECFFTSPLTLERMRPALYALLRDYYHQDPSARATRTPDLESGPVVDPAET